MKKTDEKRATTTVVEVVTSTFPAEGLEQVLTVEEDRVLRMRAGASIGSETRLASKLDGVPPEQLDELETRLALIEAELLARMPAAADAARTQRIVEALKAKAEPTEG